MGTVIMENLAGIVAALAIAAIGVAGAWVASKIGRREELGTIKTATEEAIQAAQTTVLELQQEFVEDWKAKSEDGKLTKDEITELNRMLLREARKKLSLPAEKLLNAAGVDISALILGAGKALIAQMHRDDGCLIGSPVEIEEKTE